MDSLFIQLWKKYIYWRLYHELIIIHSHLWNRPFHQGRNRAATGARWRVKRSVGSERQGCVGPMAFTVPANIYYSYSSENASGTWGGCLWGHWGKSLCFKNGERVSVDVICSLLVVEISIRAVVAVDGWWSDLDCSEGCRNCRFNKLPKVMWFCCDRGSVELLKPLIR